MGARRWTVSTIPAAGNKRNTCRHDYFGSCGGGRRGEKEWSFEYLVGRWGVKGKKGDERIRASSYVSSSS